MTVFNIADDELCVSTLSEKYRPIGSPDMTDADQPASNSFHSVYFSYWGAIFFFLNEKETLYWFTMSFSF